jgi:predicted amidohydrolase YtcJ
MKLISFLFAGSFFLLTSCSTKNNDETADLIITNARIYTVNENQPWAEAVAISDGIILKAGQSEDILKLEGPETQILDATGNFVMPGFIEGHGHFAGMGRSLMNLNFLKSRNWEEIVELVRERAQEVKPGEWIIGRGWHQEKWDHIPERQVLGYPYHDALSEVTPDNPVLLSHASGHALLANKAAMNAAGVSVETPDPSGGHIVRDGSGQAIGVFEENAERIIEAAYDQYLQNLSVEEIEKRGYKGIQLAQEECLANGVTSFQDAGSSFQDIQRYETLATEGKLDIRLWTMVRHGYDDLKSQISDFPILNAGNHFFTCRSIKASIDGALGSFGAWLLTPYLEKPGFSGQNTTEINELRRISKLAAEYNMQFCIHAIGDKANHEVLNIFENTFNEYPEKRDLRWRIEHAQHLDPDDIPRFSQLGVIASMQGIHCTSDAPYVVKRLGEKRAEDGAYVWR